MTQDDDHGDNRDPLLVRPFVLNEPGDTITDESRETWPSNPAGEPRLHRSAGDDPEADTTVLPAVPSHRRHTRRPLIVVGAIAIAVLGGISAAVAVAALRPDDRPPATSAQGDPPPLATGGPLPGTPSPAPSTPDDPAPTSRTAAPAEPPAGRGNAPGDGGGRTTNPPDDPTSAPQTETPPGDTGEIRGQDGVCLDLADNAANGTAVLVRECDDSAGQRWLVADDGTLRASGKCAAASGTAVRAADCDGRAATRWTRDGQLLINAATARCLTDPAKGTRPGTATVVATCDGNADKRWSLP